VSGKDDKKKKEEIEAIKKAADRAWKIHQGKKDKSHSNGKPKK
jgi:hypothetical protein